MMIEGLLKDGDALPSIREFAGDTRVNPLTVHKTYQLLVDEGLVESRRGRGMFVVEGARERLLHYERRQFVEQEWPRIMDRAEKLGISLESLIPVGNKQRRKRS
jgi:GntR family transcriptional regulator